MQQHPIGNADELSATNFQVILRTYRFRPDRGNFCHEPDELEPYNEVHAWHGYADAAHIYAELAARYAALQQNADEAPNRFAEIRLQRTHRVLALAEFIYFSR